MSVDKEYQLKRSRLKTSNDKVLSRRLQGVDLAVREGIVGGITGVVMEPIKEVRSGAGIKGFIRGTGAGISGVILKPAAGALDLATVVSESVRDSANYVTTNKVVVVPPVERKQLCHSFGSDGRLLALRPKDRWGYELLRYYFHLKQDVKVEEISENKIICVIGLHGDVGEKFVYVLTSSYLLGVKVIRASNPFFIWKINRTDIQEAVLCNEGQNSNRLTILLVEDAAIANPNGFHLRVRAVATQSGDEQHHQKIVIQSHLPQHAFSYKAEQENIRSLYQNLMGGGDEAEEGNYGDEEALLEFYYQRINASIFDLRSQYDTYEAERKMLEQMEWNLVKTKNYEHKIQHELTLKDLFSEATPVKAEKSLSLRQPTTSEANSQEYKVETHSEDLSSLPSPVSKKERKIHFSKRKSKSQECKIM